VFKAVQAASYDLTVFKIKWGNLTLKIYDKGGRVLRIEVVVHNAKELRSGKMLEKLPALLERMRDMLVRFLGTVQAAHVSFLDEGAFEGAGSITKCNTFLAGCCDGNQLRAFDGRGAGDADGDAGGWLQPARRCSLPWSQSVHH
jgi:hypothetical protein